MKKLISLVLAVVLCMSFAACGGTETGSEGGSNASADFTVGVCQLMEHPSLDQATEGFVAALTKAIEAAGKTVAIDQQVAGGNDLCTTVINTFTAKNVDLIMGNATPALLAAANATTEIPVLGTSVTDYSDTFGGNIPANVSGTSEPEPDNRRQGWRSVLRRRVQLCIPV